jgi:hypothetical protein
MIFSPKKKKILEKTLFFSILPTNEEKRENRHLVAYFEKSEKNVKILQVFPQFFRIFWLFLLHFWAKMNYIKKKKKKTCFFVFPLRP